MKLGVNTHFIMKFNFDEGVRFCQKLGVKAMVLSMVVFPFAPVGKALVYIGSPSALNRL